MDVIGYSRSFWAALFTFRGQGSVVFSLGRWEVNTVGRSTIIDVGDVTAVQVRQGFCWSTLRLLSASGRTEFPGLAHTAAAHLHGLFKVSGIVPGVVAATVSWDAIKSRRRYINNYAQSAWMAQHQETRVLLRAVKLEWFLPANRAQATTFIAVFDNLEGTVSRLNQEHIERELQECKFLLDDDGSEILTKMQRTAIITDQDNTLVIAGAGSGKTSVVVGKVAYLLKRLQIMPADLLLIAYNNGAASEMRERVSQQVG